MDTSGNVLFQKKLEKFDEKKRMPGLLCFYFISLPIFVRK